MTFVDALFLGMVQGLTEFFPVSSSGHLAIVESMLHVDLAPDAQLTFNVLLHGGTLLALLLCYARDWARLLIAPFTGDTRNVKLLSLIIVATVPAGVAGIFFEDVIAEHVQSPHVIAWLFLGTAAVLASGELLPERSGFLRALRKNAAEKHLTFRGAIFVGFAQAAALLPGLSRSGLTMTGARLAGLTRREALDFSFLMATPVIGGATLLTVIDIAKGGSVLPSSEIVLAGFATSFVFSIFAIMVLRRFVARYSFLWFSAYLVVAFAFAVTR